MTDRDRYGPVSRFTLVRTGRVLDDGTDRMRRQIPTAIRLLRQDPHAPVVLALEDFDPLTQDTAKAAIFTGRVVAARQPRTHADTPEDALAICLDTIGRVDLHRIGALLGDDDPASVRARLGTLVFHDPDSDRLVTAAEYLSGNVRRKLATATLAAHSDPALTVNVAALTQVQPVDLGPDEISVRLGAVWIPADIVAAFLSQILNDPTVRVEHPGGAIWAVAGDRRSIAATNTYGTTRMDALTIAAHLLEQKKIVVVDVVKTDQGEARVTNAEETDAAAEKTTALQERFTQWCWDDPDRTTGLVRAYNDTFNAIVLRTYDREAAALSLPGLAVTFTPRPHQRAAVARMIAEPSVGLFHEVGAGKTAEMVMGVMELHRLGMIRKPAIVVPNHLLEQFSREFLQIYPQASILAASRDDLERSKRRAFVARIPTGSWDAIIMSRGAFAALPVSKEAQDAYFAAKMEITREQLTRAKATRHASMTVKRLERAIAAAEERLKAALDVRRDVGVTFEQTGIDYLCIDELHDYKNLRLVSNIDSIGKEGSDRATDLDMKIHTLRSRLGERVITGATATPLPNSVAEAYIMQTYLRPDLLRDAGITDVDSWAGTFGQLVTEIELAPAGAGNYRTKTRLSKFTNVPELLRMWHVSADIKTAEDLNLPTPALAARPDGQRAPEIVLVPPTAQIEAFVAALGERAEAVKARQVEPTLDNMLTITKDGQKAALDMRLIDPYAVAADRERAPDGSLIPAKVEVAADKIHDIWLAHRDQEYCTATGAISPANGALQIVFCDLSTPTGHGPFNIYDELKALLIQRGMNPTRIRYIHEASNDAAKAALFADCRDGRVDVLLGSTTKMGVGTNIQTRAVALHHLDVPWRPADITQREGRILRQGNQNNEVRILRYVVERSFDAYSWQTVERKARFINQLMRGRLDVREIEDIGDGTLSCPTPKSKPWPPGTPSCWTGPEPTKKPPASNASSAPTPAACPKRDAP